MVRAQLLNLPQADLCVSTWAQSKQAGHPFKGPCYSSFFFFFFFNHEHVLHGWITWRRNIKWLLSLQFYALRVALKSGGKQEQPFEQVPNSGHPSLPHVLAENIAAIAQLPDSNKIFHNCFEVKHNKTNEDFSKISMKCVLY